MRGLEVSLGGLRQDELVQGKIRDRFAKTFILLLKTLQFPQLIRPHTPIVLTPAIVRLFGNTDLPNRINPGYSLSHKHLNLA